MTHLLILGAGSLVRELVTAIPGATGNAGRSGTLRVTVCSREASRAEWLSLLGRARARLAGAEVEFDHAVVDWEDVDRISSLIGVSRPDAIFHAASFQSAWSLGAANRWSQLVGKAGYGVTAALQAALLSRLGKAISRSGLKPRVVNACYPDLVNAGAAALGVDIVCGVGNIALLAERIRLHNPGRPHFKLLAGHWDVARLGSAWSPDVGPPPIWSDQGAPVPDMFDGIPPLTTDNSLNNLNGSVTAPLILAIAAGADLDDLHVPGPMSLPGGYPIRISRGVPELALPEGVEAAWAVEWNSRRMKLDGASVEEGRFVRFSPAAADLLEPHLPEFAGGFDLAQVESVAEDFLRLRDALSRY
jgi:hypothetical protein